MPANDPIASLLAGDYVDPQTGEKVIAQSKSVVIEDSLEGREVELVAALDIGSRLALLSDPITHAAMGARVERALRSRYRVQSIVLPSPHADMETVARLSREIEPSVDAVIAVGSGTLNDLAKMVAHGRNIPQLVFATAPSMNGYTSLSASITNDGMKSSYRVKTPLAAFFDLGVLSAAPLRLIRSGLGDSTCRPTCQADWLLSHLLLDRPYRELPFALLADDELALFSHARALVEGDLTAMRHLVRTLVLSGFGMTLCNGSFPASQGEHLISHYVEMVGPRELPHAFHGEQIAVGTLLMADIQDAILRRDRPPVLRPSTLTREQIVAHFGEVIGDACWREYEGKRFDATQTDALNDRLASRWDEIRERIRRVTLGASVQREVLEVAGVPTAPAQLGWSQALVDGAIAHAREIRNRYTFLDLRADSV